MGNRGFGEGRVNLDEINGCSVQLCLSGIKAPRILLTIQRNDL